MKHNVYKKCVPILKAFKGFQLNMYFSSYEVLQNRWYHDNINDEMKRQRERGLYQRGSSVWRNRVCHETEETRRARPICEETRWRRGRRDLSSRLSLLLNSSATGNSIDALSKACLRDVSVLGILYSDIRSRCNFIRPGSEFHHTLKTSIIKYVLNEIFGSTWKKCWKKNVTSTKLLVVKIK